MKGYLGFGRSLDDDVGPVGPPDLVGVGVEEEDAGLPPLAVQESGGAGGRGLEYIGDAVDHRGIPRVVGAIAGDRFHVVSLGGRVDGSVEQALRCHHASHRRLFVI